MHHILKLISEGEHQQLDFKFEVADASKIARSLVSFANTDGGRLLIGVKDNGSIAGIRSDEEYYMIDSSAKMYCRPPVIYTFKEWTLQKKNILEVIIPPSDNRPHYALQKEGIWTAYHRVADQNFPVNRILFQVWKMEAQEKGVYLEFTDNERFILSFLETNASITLSKFIRNTGINRNKAERILVKLLLLKIITMHFTENSTIFKLNPDYQATVGS